MPDNFPIPAPERLPARISPCPIVEAVFEVRFTSRVAWATLPGMLYAQVRKEYPRQRELPLAQMPEQIRKQDPRLANLPLLQFLGRDFLIQTGPNVASLVTRPNTYPGWPAIRQELQWFLGKLREADVVDETERIGVRYIDFFPGDVLDFFNLGLQVNGEPIASRECAITMVLHKEALAMRLQITNSAIIDTREGPQRGTVLDVDSWFNALDAKVFENGLQRFEEAHEAIKSAFFGLLKPEFLNTLNPEYE